MTPQELLVATEKAAGNEHLLEWHTSLIETGQTLKKLNTVNHNFFLSFDFNSEIHTPQELATEHSELETLERRNANLEKDVNAYMQRREIERRVELLEVVLPVKEYLQAKAEYDKAKEERKKVHEKVQELEAQNKPVVDFRA